MISWWQMALVVGMIGAAFLVADVRAAHEIFAAGEGRVPFPFGSVAVTTVICARMFAEDRRFERRIRRK